MIPRHGLKDYGDGMRRGQPIETDRDLNSLVYSGGQLVAPPISLEILPFFGIVPQGARKTREQSKHLSRLQLLKELFNVFLNRAVSQVACSPSAY